MKSKLLWLLVLAVLAASIWNEYREEDQHTKFFEDMRSFANKGDRFTSQDGLILCYSVSASQEAHGMKPLNCDEMFETNRK